MPVSQADALRIHAAIHGGKDSVRLASGATLPVTKASSRCRCVQAEGIDAREQNTGKPSKWADMAKAGSKITWFLGGSPQQWGRIVDGAVDQLGKQILGGGAEAKAKAAAKAAAAPPAKAKADALSEPPPQGAAKAKLAAKATAKASKEPVAPEAKRAANAPQPADGQPPAKRAKCALAAPAASPPPGTAAVASAEDPLGLAALFCGKGYGAVWEPILRPVIDKLPNAAGFIGPGRPKQIVPIRELTLQALKPNPPSGWRVISLGQSPYPRVESATGIAHFDNSISSWDDGRFGAVVSMRNIIKAAAMHKYGIPKATPSAEFRKLLRDRAVVNPAEWFQAMLTQGVLFMNAACTLLPPEDKSVRAGSVVEEHRKFWAPVIEAILGAILAECRLHGKGLVFAWWGGESLKLKKEFAKTIFAAYRDVRMEHVEHKNPAAMQDAFLDEPNIFGAINDKLKALQLGLPIDWLPSDGWQHHLCTDARASAMGEFITETKELHRMYLERLRDGLDSGNEELADITGVESSPLVPLAEALRALKLADAARQSTTKAQAMNRGALGIEEAAAVHMYTTNHLYRQLNAALRSAQRCSIQQYFLYLRILLAALSKLPSADKELYRGVPLDLSSQYAVGSEVTWWAVSSCTPDLKVACSFGASQKACTLFRIKAQRSVGIRELSQYKGEEEFILAPGTQLRVDKVQRAGGRVEIFLRELDRPRRVR